MNDERLVPRLHVSARWAVGLGAVVGLGALALLAWVGAVELGVGVGR